MKDNNEFLRQTVNYAVVVAGRVKDIQELKQKIVETNVSPIFQKISVGKLKIIEE